MDLINHSYCFVSSFCFSFIFCVIFRLQHFVFVTYYFLKQKTFFLALICDPEGQLDETTKLERSDDIWNNINVETFDDLSNLAGLGIADVEKLNNEVAIDYDAWELDEHALVKFLEEFNDTIGNPYLSAYQNNTLPYNPKSANVYVRRRRGKSMANFELVDGHEISASQTEEENVSDEVDADEDEKELKIDVTADEIDMGSDEVKEKDDEEESPQTSYVVFVFSLLFCF